jgi:hypothetical protein
MSFHTASIAQGAPMVIKRVGPLSCAKISGTLYAIMGLVVGAIVSVVSMAGGFASDNDGAGAIGAMIGASAIVVLPLLYGCMGFIVTLIGAWIYNVLAGLVGGIELEVQ